MHRENVEVECPSASWTGTGRKMCSLKIGCRCVLYNFAYNFTGNNIGSLLYTYWGMGATVGRTQTTSELNDIHYRTATWIATIRKCIFDTESVTNVVPWYEVVKWSVSKTLYKKQLYPPNLNYHSDQNYNGHISRNHSRREYFQVFQQFTPWLEQKHLERRQRRFCGKFTGGVHWGRRETSPCVGNGLGFHR